MLELLDLSRRFGDIVALDGVTFSIPDGEIVGFVGPNGAGKTTTMRIALGVLEPTRATSDGTGVRSTRRRGGASGTCPRSAACTRR